MKTLYRTLFRTHRVRTQSRSSRRITVLVTEFRLCWHAGMLLFCCCIFNAANDPAPFKIKPIVLVVSNLEGSPRWLYSLFQTRVGVTGCSSKVHASVVFQQNDVTPDFRRASSTTLFHRKDTIYTRIYEPRRSSWLFVTYSSIRGLGCILAYADKLKLSDNTLYLLLKMRKN